MIDFSKVEFIKSAPSYKEAPFELKSEIIFVGKSNVGKSSLINALTKRRNLAHTSSKPGFTKLLNYYNVDNTFYLVDAPGYGYTISGSKHLDNFAKMMESYFDNPRLKGVIFLVDSRHDLTRDDEDFYHYIVDKHLPFVIVFTKVDKLNQSEKAKVKKRAEALGISDYLLVSNQDNNSIRAVENKIASLVK